MYSVLKALLVEPRLHSSKLYEHFSNHQFPLMKLRELRRIDSIPQIISFWSPKLVPVHAIKTPEDIFTIL